MHTGYDTVVIAHADCPDGMVAAWAFTQASKYGKDFGTIKFHFTRERDIAKDTDFPLILTKDVYIVDYSYTPEVLFRMSCLVKSLTVLDHHKTALEMFTEVPNYCHFDMNRCGAEIAWDHLYGKETRPWFMKHIRDCDLWLWEDPNSKAFSAATRDVKFEYFDKLLETNPDEIYSRGKNILEFEEKTVRELCANAELVEFEGYPVYALNTILYRSECGNELALKENVKFALLYRFNITKNEYSVSLRGVAKHGINLADIAKKYGGGGHSLACAFTYNGSLSDILKPLKL